MGDKTHRNNVGLSTAKQWLPGMPLIEVLGDQRVLIERHHGVLAYDTERINVKVCFGEITVHGQELMLAKMSQEQLVIVGKIQGVSICRRCANAKN